MRVLIFTHGKTGSTALAYRLKAAYPGCSFVFEPKLLPLDLGADAVVKYFANSPTEAAGAMEAFDRRILLVRHPFDFIVSWVLYIPASLPELTISRRASRVLDAVRNCERMKSGFREVFRTLCEVSRVTEADLLFQLKNLMQVVKETDVPFYRFSYESLVANDVGGLENYLGVSLARQVEVDSRHEHVSRTRGKDNWRHWFDAGDIAYFGRLADVGEYASMFGYDIASEAVQDQVRDPAEGSRYVQVGIDRNCARAGLLAPVDVVAAVGGPAPTTDQVALEETFVDVIRAARTGDGQLEFRLALLCLLNGVANAVVFHSVARGLNELGQHEAAELAARRSTAANAASVGPWHQLALARSALGKLPEALQAALEVCVREPGESANFRVVGSLHAKLGQWHEAELAYVTGAYLPNGDASYHRLAAAAMWEQGRIEEALACLDVARANYPGAWDLPFMAANILFSLARLPEALAMATEAVSLTDADTPVGLFRQIARRLAAISK